MRRALIALCALALACGDDDSSPAERPGTPSVEGSEGAQAPAPDAPPATGREIVRFDLARHAARAERFDGDTLLVDFGEPGAAKYTLGGWRTRTGDDHAFDGVTTTLIPGVIGELALPAATAGTHELVLRARAFGDGRVTLYVGEDAVAYPQLPRDGSFATVRATIAAGKLAAGENVIQLRVGARGRDGAVQAGLALDWLRLGPEGDAGLVDQTPSPVVSGSALSLPPRHKQRFAFEVPRGAFLLGDARGALRVRALRETGALVDLGRHEGELRVDLAPVAGELVRLELAPEGASGVEVRAARVATFDAPVGGRVEVRPTRNVLIYLVDTVRADKLRPWNPETRVQTPGLDRWVQRAAVFERGYTQENWTKPSVATLLTGLLPWQHTATSGEAVLPRSVEMLSETLQGAGFHTGAFVANGYVSDKFGFQQGWRTWRNYIREGRRSAATFVAADVLEWLDARPQDRPFFLYVHTIDPHVPYIPPEETLALYDGEDYHGPVDFTNDRGLLEKIKAGRLRLNDRDKRRLEALYDGEITYHDTHFASILDGLERRGLRDDTLVVFTADHGEEFFDHDSVGHGHSLYEELLHVPFVVRVPGIESPVRVAEPVGLVDVVPTVLDALGREVPSELPGRSLLPLLRGEVSDAPRVNVSGFMDGWRAVIAGRYKLIQRTHRRWTLFDLEADPGETRDLAAERPHTVRYLRGLLGLSLRGATAGRHRAERTEIDPETDAQLRALGYIGSQRPD
ncbi:MAG: sulfatase-like hydrolase/transferase [Myxococcales bacterium]|nr:sulfatase-like hydrolase/transferase [Myxococcales bacterium]